MAGNASNADDDELPNLDDDEAENESTVAMQAPSFDRAGIPLPVSKPPPKPAEPSPPAGATAAPAPAPAEARAAAAPDASPNPAPVGNQAPAGTAAATPAKASGGPARPAFAAAPPKAAGAAAAKPGKQTVIGLAPPAARPATPGPRVPVAVPKPSTAASGREAPKPASEEQQEAAPKPSTARSAFAATFPSQYSFGSGPSAGTPATSSRSEERPEQNDAATVTVPKDVLDRVRANPKAVLAGSENAIPRLGGDDDEGYEETKLAGTAPAAPPAPARVAPAAPVAGVEGPRKLHADDEEDYEETKAVPREDLLRQQDAHVVVGSDAKGEDATLAVPPSANEAALLNNISAAIGESLQHPPTGGYPPPPGGHPHQSPHGGMGGTMGMPQAPAWSSNHMPAAPRVLGGSPSYGGGPMAGPQMGAQGGIPRGTVPTNWSPLQSPQGRRRISGQMIVLLIVGFVCLAIFVTGIVLFATTKF